MSGIWARDWRDAERLSELGYVLYFNGCSGSYWVAPSAVIWPARKRP